MFILNNCIVETNLICSCIKTVVIENICKTCIVKVHAFSFAAIKC